MVKKLQVYISETLDPYENLATEKILLDTVEKDSVILYLWQNENTVVIGHNQNAWAECKTDALKRDNVNLARRLSGGGAVFHDIGNLNFTFLVSSDNYDLLRQMQVIKKACSLAGIETEISGRNDILAGGRKFSGNAFYNSKGNSYHHGTLMICADTEKMSEYLTPSKSKLQSKGIKSVSSRVINLNELSENLGVNEMKKYMVLAAEQVYGLNAEFLGKISSPEKDELTKIYGSWDYIYGTAIPCTFSCESKFDWGIIQIEIAVKSGEIENLQVFTDSLDYNLAEKIKTALENTRFETQEISARLKSALEPVVADDIIGLINSELF